MMTQVRIDNDTLTIEDVPDFNGSGHIARVLKNDEGSYSSIWLDRDLVKQPSYPGAQDKVEVHFEHNAPSHALVLGGGGCSIPRFLLLRYPKVKVKTVELSADIINIAHTFFLSDLSQKQLDRHNLMQGDAIAQVEREEENLYDLVFVDLFEGGAICQKAFYPDFANHLMRITRPDACIIYNVSLSSREDAELVMGILYPKTTIEFVEDEGYNFVYIKK